MADVDREEDVYTVIPTAPEDVLESSNELANSPSLVNKKVHAPPVSAVFNTINGSHKPAAERNGSRTPRESNRRRDGLPSHAFSRNYYCRFCSFNTTKSKVHLYHLVDVHGVDYKIFSCDRCDYASRWKCKVIRHRKMIHKINEPKFEPEMHDSRSQTGKRPPPEHLPPAKLDTTISTNNANSRQTFPGSARSTLPSFVSPFGQQQLAGQPVNPFTNPSLTPRGKTATDNQPSAMMMSKREETNQKGVSGPSRADNGQSRRKQRKPVSVRKVVGDGEEQVYEQKMDVEVTSRSHDSIQGDEMDPLSGLFGGADESTEGILSGPSWRRKLMPTPVTLTTGTVADSTGGVSPRSDDASMNKIPQNNNNIGVGTLKPSVSQVSMTSSHSNQSIADAVQHVDENSMDEETLFKEKLLEEITIDDEPHYKCSECTFITRYRWKAGKHYKSTHDAGNQFNCTSCSYSTSNRVDFFSHKATHSSRPWLSRLATPSMLSQANHKCAECSFVASSKSHLERHMASHKQELPHISKRLTHSDMEDSQDEGAVNGDGEFNCELCGYTARNWSKMKEHMIRHSEGTPFACSYCDSKYKRPADLNRHLKIKHNTCLADIGLDGPTLKGVMGPAFSGTGIDESSAADDGMSAAVKRAYQGDSTLGADSDGDDEPKRLCIDEDGMNLQCNKCTYVAKWRSDLERHMKQVHSEEKRFGCPICFKSYKYQGDLNVHMRKAHSAGHVRSPKQSLSPMTMPSSMCKTPPPNVQVLSNEVIVNMSHAAIVNPLANLGPPLYPSSNQPDSPEQQFQLPHVSSAPQMPMLKPAPLSKSGREKSSPSTKDVIKLNSDGKPIKKGELDPSTMVHVAGGEFKCLNCRYETNFKSHLDAHMRIHPEKPFHCKFCTYASYWRGDTKKHIEKNHPEKLPEGVNPYNLVEQVFEEAVRNSPHRHKPLPDVHNVAHKHDIKSDKGMIWTPPNEDVCENTGAAAKPDQLKIPTLQPSPPASAVSPSVSKPSGRGKASEDGPPHVQCPHCNYNTTSESRLNAHMATHYNLKIFKCPDCGKRANWKWDIQKHMRTDHPDCIDEVIVMDTTEAKDTLDEYLKQHPEQRGKPKIGVSVDFRPENWPKPRVRSANHEVMSSSKATSIRPFRCSICSRRSNWKCDIRKHYRQVHSGRTDARVELMTREELLAAGEKASDVDQHYPEVRGGKSGHVLKPFRCSLCGKSSKWKWDVAKHIKMMHRGVPDVHVVEDEDVADALDSDPGTPDLPSSLAGDGDMDVSFPHSPSPVPARTKERSSPDPHPRSTKNGPKIGSFQCSVCSQFSEFMWVIRRHIRALHPNNPDAKIVDLSTKGEEAAHSDSRPYICSLCGKRSNWKWDVKKHILSVHRGSMGSILDELLNKETVIYTDGKTMEVDDGKTQQKIADIQTHIKEEASITRSNTPTPSPAVVSSNNSCYSSLPTMVGLQSAVAPTTDTGSEGGQRTGESVRKQDNANVKFKCGYCFFASTSRNETVRHVRAEHDGKILRIQTLNKSCRDEQTTYKAAHRTSGAGNTNSMWQCSQCSFKHARKEEALMHIAQHDLYNAYQCAICDFADDMEYTLHKHIKARHDVDQVETVLLQNIVYAPCPEEPAPVASAPTSAGVIYTCNQCDMKTAWRSAIVRHIKEKHIIEGDIHSMFTKHGSNKPESSSAGDHNRRYNCTHCPYKTDKVSMFNDHMERHKAPRSEADMKCSYCDYWVSASRLLHQHIKLHQQDCLATATALSMNGEDNSKSERFVANNLQCPECPYRGKAKDLNAHKKLHKQRPGAIYKCPDCNYWVNHNRLLQQHVKVHSPRYRQKVFTSTLNLGETSIDDVAAFKQHLISNQVEPVKLEPADAVDRLTRKQHKCLMCPFSSSLLSRVDAHAAGHGAFTETALKCKFCDFYCESRELMAQHIKVHSLQYQGEADDDEAQLYSNGEEEEVGNKMESTAGFSVKYTSDGLVLDKEKKGVTSRKYCCEKCPYASALKDNFRRHVSLHGSKQGITCGFCDYSVPSEKLLMAHEELHRQPNLNLLATQSIMNLTKLKPIAADLHLAQTSELVDGSVTTVHDHLSLYENGDSVTDGDARSGNSPALEDEGEPEFIDLAELGSKVTTHTESPNMASDESSDSADNAETGNEEMEDGEEVWICRFCDRAFDSESQLTLHEQQHS